MLSREQNETLCRVGPGTPMGELLRRYWVPALLSSDLPAADCDPVAFRLLGERFVAFRDSNGTAGILDEACPHRGASLALGRVEDGGIRCIYHGWKMACDGTILETPNLRNGSEFRAKVKAPAYPVHEAGDFIWVYLGPPAKQPPFPAYGFTHVPAANRAVARARIDCNWVQVAENPLDCSHIGILHADYHDFFFGAEDAHEPGWNGSAHGQAPDNAPEIEVQETDFGFRFAAMRGRAAPSRGERKAIVGAFIFPFAVVLPGNPQVQTTRAGLLWAIPADDTHTNVLTVGFDTENPIDRAQYLEHLGYGFAKQWDGDHLECYPENRYLQDRSKLGESATGIDGLLFEDLAITVAQGPIVDRTRDHLVPMDDKVVIHLRNVLLENARIVQAGGDPLGVALGTPPTISVGHGIVPEGAEPWPAIADDLPQDRTPA